MLLIYDNFHSITVSKPEVKEMDQYARNFCRNVLYLRHLHGLTRKEMAQIIGIGTSKLVRIEQEKFPLRISAGMLCRLCDHFDLSADTVLKEELSRK